MKHANPLTYETMLKKVFLYGTEKGDRTGTGTKSIFGMQARWDLSKGFPLVTTKKVPLKLVAAELLWFLSGSTDNRDLQAMGCHIWDEWALGDDYPEHMRGDLGPIYGAQWRSWGRLASGVDQIAALVKGIKEKPNSRRHIVSAWNVSELPDESKSPQENVLSGKMALAPCHALFQFDVTNGKLSCQLYQRSADMFLGVPFNIASYALLTHMVAQQCDLTVGDFIWTGGDCHVYRNHREQVAEQLNRLHKAPDFPTLEIVRKPASIFEYQLDDFVLHGYEPLPAIKAPVAV